MVLIFAHMGAERRPGPAVTRHISTHFPVAPNMRKWISTGQFMATAPEDVPVAAIRQA
jgi:hypothetical protein